MLSIFTKIKNNTIWVLNGEIVVIFKTTWFFSDTISPYPMVYYYYLKDKTILCFITRAEFLLNAQKYNIEENEGNYTKV